jgi:hypothetical protein
MDPQRGFAQAPVGCEGRHGARVTEQMVFPRPSPRGTTEAESWEDSSHSTVFQHLPSVYAPGIHHEPHEKSAATGRRYAAFQPVLTRYKRLEIERKGVGVCRQNDCGEQGLPGTCPSSALASGPRRALLTRRHRAVVHCADLPSLHQAMERTGDGPLGDTGDLAHLGRPEPLRPRGREGYQDLSLTIGRPG